MPSSSRPRGSSAGGSQNYSRIPPVTPMSERQQMALLMQMTSNQSDTHSTTVNASSPSPGPSGVTSRTRERNERGETALHVAAIKGDLDQINKLLEQGHNPNVGDFAGWTPLHEACNHGWYTVAAALVKAGANVNARGLDDDTPLHDAATNGQMKLVRLLVEKGADPTFKNRKGKSACEVAAPAVYNYLLAAKAESTANQYVIHTGRAREEKKSEGKKPTSTEEAAMDPKPPASGPLEDVYDFKPGVKEGGTATLAPDKPTDANADTNSGETIPSQSKEEPTAGTKRNVSETSETNEDCDEDVKRKKRKDSDCVKEAAVPKVNTVRTIPGKTGKTPGPASKTMMGPKLGSNVERKSPCASPKPTIKTDSDAEPDEKCGETGFSMKVPPLKIVIPQSGSEGDSGGNRNGKTSSQRTHVALPYVVASNSNDSDKDGLASSVGSPADSTKSDDKKSGNVNFSGALQDDRQQPRVLRSSYRGSCASSGSGQGSVDRGSNNSSPQLQASVPPSPPNHSPVVSEPAQASTSSAGQATSTVTSQPAGGDNETPTNSSASPSSSNPPQQKEAAVELHPRKRKIKASKDAHTTATTSVATSSCSQQDNQEVKSDVHPHDQPITNCYQMFLNIRKQIERRQKSLFPVQPKPPQGFKDYLMNRCTYALAGNKTKEPVVTLPASLPTSLRDLFTQQEHQRYKLKMQHVVEKEKLVLAVEQEILRVHGRAARALANQALPFSVCTILKDQEVYNIITPEQEEKDRNARSRYNGRLFLSWLQDVDDKWEKIKEAMLLRHHNEAESLHAVQKMDWDWQLKELNLSDQQSSPVIEEGHVPMVHVSDDFDLLPA